MIRLKSPSEIEKMRCAGKLLAGIFVEIATLVKPGAAARKLDETLERMIIAHGAKPAFKGYRGGNPKPFPTAACVSIEHEVVHGIPGNRRFESGQIVSIDAGLELDGWFADMAVSFLVGEADSVRRDLWRVTREALYKGIEQAREGNRLQDVSGAVQDWVEGHGFSVVRDLVGHGIGSTLHEEPVVPNYRMRKGDLTLRAGMTLAIEPMVSAGRAKVKFLSDGWTAVTSDRSPAGHFEHTVLVTEDEPVILTLLGDGRDPHWLINLQTP